MSAPQAACPLSTRGGTRLVQLVRERGGGGQAAGSGLPERLERRAADLRHRFSLEQRRHRRGRARVGAQERGAGRRPRRARAPRGRGVLCRQRGALMLRVRERRHLARGETCPVSTEGGTRRVQLVREGGGRGVGAITAGAGGTRAAGGEACGLGPVGGARADTKPLRAAYARGTRRVRLVRGEGRGVSDQYEGEGGGGRRGVVRLHPLSLGVRKARRPRGGQRRAAGFRREAPRALRAITLRTRSSLSPSHVSQAAASCARAVPASCASA